MLRGRIPDNFQQGGEQMACESEQAASDNAAATLVLATIAKAEADANALIKQLEFLEAVAAYQVAKAALDACLIANPAPPGEDPPGPVP